MYWGVYGLEMYEQRAAEMMQQVERERLLRELAAVRRAEQEEKDRMATAAVMQARLLRRALAAAGSGLVHLGRWLEGAAQQPSL